MKIQAAATRWFDVDQKDTSISLTPVDNTPPGTAGNAFGGGFRVTIGNL